MLTPSFIKLSDSAIAAYKISDAGALASHFRNCSRGRISGRLDLSVRNDPKPVWSFFFRLGRLVWSMGAFHPYRRWNRQLLQYCPELAGTSLPQKPFCSWYWNYESLLDLMQQGKMQQNQLSAIVTGNILELLFDVMQAARSVSQPLEIALTYRPLAFAATASSESAWYASCSADQVWRQAGQAWLLWQQQGLDSISPNLAPVIWDSDGLRQQTSLLVYHNLTTLANGNWTLRDLAVKLKQPLVPLTRSLLPYVQQGLMALNPAGDLQPEEKPADRFTVAYVEDSRFDSAAMSRILDQAGHRFISIPDALQAIPVLLEQKPDLIFLDLLMPVANGYEVCAQIRRITAFKDIPIVILTSSDGIVDRVRAKLVGASGFLSKPIESDKILNTLRQYLPEPVSP